MKKKIALAMAFVLAVVGIIYIYKTNSVDLLKNDGDSGLELSRLPSATAEEIKSRVDREVERGQINNLADLELMAKMYPENQAYKKAIFTTYYDQDPNKGLQYAGKAFMENGDKEILNLLSDKTSKTFKYSQDSRYETVKDLAEQTASKIFGTWKDVFFSPYFNADAPYYLKNVIQVELMDGPDGNLYVLTYGNTPFQETISQGKKIPANQAEVYKIEKDGQVSFVSKLINDDKEYTEVIYRKVGSNLEFSQSTSLVNLQSEIAFFGSTAEEISKLNQEILDKLEHNSLSVDWTGYENLAPFAKAYMEEVFKIQNLKAKKAQADGNNQAILKKGFLVDLDQDGVLDLVLLTSHSSATSKSQGLYIYSYYDNQAVNIFKYEDVSEEAKAYNFNLDAGLLEENGKTYVYIAHSGDSGYFVNTSLGLLSKEKGSNIVYQEEGYSNTAFMSYLAADESTNQYEEADFVESSSLIKPNPLASYEEAYYDLRDRIFGPDPKFFITDAKAQVDPKTLKEGETGVEDFKYPPRDQRGNLIYEGYDNYLTEDQLLSLLLIPVEQAVDFPIIRRFRIGDQIFPADILKIRADSTGHINASIFRNQEDISLKVQEDILEIDFNGQSYKIQKPMVDEKGAYYVPFASFKEMGIIAKDQGHIVDLAFDKESRLKTKASSYQDLKAQVDKEILMDQVSSLKDLELVSVLEADPIYKLERLKAYKKEDLAKAYGYAREFFLESGDSQFIKPLTSLDFESLTDQDQDLIKDLEEKENFKDSSKAYMKKLVDLADQIKDQTEKTGILPQAIAYDLDQDRQEELYVKIVLEDEILILAYDYDQDQEDLVQIFADSIDRRFSQNVDFGINNQEGQAELYIVEDYKDDLSRTQIRSYKKDQKGLSLDQEVYKTLVSDQEEDQGPIYSFEIKEDMKNSPRAEKAFKEIRQDLYGSSPVYFYSDGQPKDVGFSQFPNSYKLAFEDLITYLSIEENLDYYPAIIRRFMIDDLIYPASSLKINTDSKGYVDLKLLDLIDEVEIKKLEDSTLLINNNKEYPLSKLIEDEDGTVYLALDQIKDLGLVKEDRGPIIVLGK